MSPQRLDERPELVGVMQAIAAEDHGWALPGPGTQTWRRPRLSQESICQDLSNAGFEVEQVEEFSYEQSAEAQRAWLSITIFTKDRLPGLPYQHRMRVLEKAYERLEPRRDSDVAMGGLRCQGELESIADVASGVQPPQCSDQSCPSSHRLP